MIFFCIVSLLRPTGKFLIKNIKGLDNLPAKAPYIIAINHASLADPIFLAIALKNKLKSDVNKLFFIAKRKLIWRIFTFTVAEKLFNLLIIDPANKKLVLDRGEKLLSRQKIVVVFFEGTRTLTGRIQKGKTGIARLALKSQQPIVPVALKGTYEFWGRGKIIPRFRKNIEIIIGQAIDLNNYYHKNINKAVLYEITEKVSHSVQDLLIQK